MSNVVRHHRRPQRVTPPPGCQVEYLHILGTVEPHHDGTVTITPSSRHMELMLEGLLNYWSRGRRRTA